MLTRKAQPTSPPAAPIRNELRAVSGALAVAIAVLCSLVLPSGGAAATGGSGAWPWPLLGEVVTPFTNGSDPYAAGQHRGLDIAAPVGSPVLAIVEGHVSFAGKLPDGGLAVTVASADGEWLISALHLSERSVVRGQSVGSGALLGRVGTTGRRSIERGHLHLSLRRAKSRSYVDPLSMLGRPRLPSTAATTKTVPAEAALPVRAQAQPVQPQAQVRPQAQPESVHAQKTGGSKPAHSHGAVSEPSAARSSAGSRAREGHVTRSASGRVAPPPLQRPAEVSDSRPGTRPAPLETPVQSEPVSGPSQSAGPPRALLFAIAAICLAVLFVRRRPAGSHDQRPSAPPTEQAEEAAAAADVIAIESVRRAANGS